MANEYEHGATDARLSGIERRMQEHDESDTRQFESIHKELRTIRKDIREVSEKMSTMRGFFTGAGAVIGAIMGIVGTIITNKFFK